MIKKVLMLVVSLALVLSLVPGSVAAASPTEVSEYDIAKTSAGAGLAQEREYTRAINKLERFLTISETGNIVLDAPKRVVRSIDSEVYKSLLAGLEQTNSMIDSGYLVANPDFTLTVTEKYLEDSNVEGFRALSSSGGIDDIVYHWWGFHLYLSDDTCDALAAALEAGGISAGVIGGILAAGGITIPGGIAALIVGGILGIGAVLINYYNRNNTGVVIRFHYLIGFTGIWSQ